MRFPMISNMQQSGSGSVKLTVLVWTPERLLVITDGSNYTLELAIASEERYWLSLSADYRNYLFLGATQGRRPFWINRDEGRSFKPLGVVPGKGPMIPGYHCRSHYGSGMATVIKDHTLWLNSGVDEWNCSTGAKISAENVIKSYEVNRKENNNAGSRTR
jgi:hypothetical protein